MPAVLQDDGSFGFDDAGAESHEITLNERHDVAVTICSRNVFGVTPQRPRFFSPPRRGRHRSGSSHGHCVDMISGSVDANMTAQHFDAGWRKQVCHYYFHVIAI